MSDRKHLTEDEAARLWKHAAALQAEAAHRLESLSGELQHVTDDHPHTDDPPDSGYAIEHVRAAAVGAGIGAEYLEAALVNLETERALPDAPERGVLARRLLRDFPGTIASKRIIEATPNEVLAAMEKVFSVGPNRLLLSDQKGNVLDGGVLVFDIEGATADLRQIYASIRPIDDGRRCELTLRGPVAWAESRNAGLGAAMIAMASGVGYAVVGEAGGAVAAAVAAAGIVSIPVAGFIAAASAIAGLLAAGGAGTVGYRALYGYSMRHMATFPEGLLSSVAMEAQGGWALDTDGQDAVADPEELPNLSP